MGDKHRSIFPQLCPWGDRVGLLQFADDMILFFNAKDKWASIINETLNLYALDSGQKINRSKSDLIFLARTQAVLRGKIKEILVVDDSSQISYLGSTLKLRVDRKGDNDTITGKIDHRLNGWKGSSLSPAGRRILIQSITSMIPNYWMSFQVFRKSVTTRIQQVQVCFLRSGQHASKI